MDSDTAPIDTAGIDTVLTTTRAVRRRLDLDRDVPNELLLDCIDIAEQAPTGGNQGSRRWLVIRDPDTKAQLGDLYRSAGGEWLTSRAAALEGTGHPNEGTVRSSAYLAEHLQDVPAIVIPTILGRHDGSGNPGLFDSVIQAAWSFCLAARARGLGTAWTTLHLQAEDDVAELLAIPDGVTQIALLPVAYTIGTDFGRARRRPAAEITWFDRWGHTAARAGDAPHRLAARPGAVAEIDIDCRPEDIWPLVTDIALPARHSAELQSAEWLDGVTGPELGARLVGTNRREGLGEWQTTSTVVELEPNRRFAWAVGDPEAPLAVWAFELEPLAGATRVRQSYQVGPGPSGLTAAVAQRPEMEERIVRSRQSEVRRSMEANLAAIKATAERTPT